MLSVVTPAGTLRVMVNEGTTTAEVFVNFCKHLLHDADGSVYLVIDGHSAYRAAATSEDRRELNRRYSRPLWESQSRDRGVRPRLSLRPGV